MQENQNQMGVELIQWLESLDSPKRIREVQELLNSRLASIFPILSLQFADLMGKSISLKIGGGSLVLFFEFQKEGLGFSINRMRPANLHLEANLLSLFRYFLYEDPVQALSFESFHTRGERGILSSFHALMRLIRFVNWEALLDSLLGIEKSKSLKKGILSMLPVFNEEQKKRKQALQYFRKERLPKLARKRSLLNLEDSIKKITQDCTHSTAEFEIFKAKGVFLKGEPPKISNPKSSDFMAATKAPTIDSFALKEGTSKKEYADEYLLIAKQNILELQERVLELENKQIKEQKDSLKNQDFVNQAVDLSSFSAPKLQKNVQNHTVGGIILDGEVKFEEVNKKNQIQNEASKNPKALKGKSKKQNSKK